MPKPLLGRTIVSHWHKHYEDFQTSALEFYTAVEASLARREIPGLKIGRIAWREGGGFSAKRVYLRASRERLCFDLCAAPFGTGYFFSWWQGERAPSRWLALLLFLPIGLAFLLAPRFVHFVFWGTGLRFGGGRMGNVFPTLLIQVSTIAAGVLLFVLFIFLIRFLLRYWLLDPDEPIIAIPLIGSLYQRLFKPLTYYRVDSMLMFRDSVRAAVNEVLEGITKANGLRALTDDEKKPIMPDFLRR
jgi:hypothetical protein